MKTIVLDGKNASVKETEVPPHLVSGFVYIKVFAVSVDSGDLGIRYGNIGKYFTNMQKSSGFGRDFSGVVVSVGDSVNRLGVGDEVFGLLLNPIQERSGSEYIIVHESVCALKPKNISHEEAASIVTDAMTAERVLRTIKANNNDTLLITGGIQSITRCLIQLASSSMFESMEWIACTVDKMCDREYVESLGAAETFDTTCNKGAWSLAFSTGSNKKSYDIVIDTIGDSKRARLLLEKGGRFVSLYNKPTPSELLDYETRAHTRIKGFYRVLISSGTTANMTTGCSGRTAYCGGNYFSCLPTGNGEILERLSVLIETGELTPLVEKSFSLDQSSEAVSYFYENWKTMKGRVVIRLVNS